MASVVLAEDESLTLDVSDLINHGNQLSNVGNYTEATTYFDRAINIQPNNTDALYGKGLALDNFGNHKNAIDIYNKILSIDPYNMDAMASKGVILFNTGNQTEALNYFQKVLTLKNNTTFRSMFDKGVSSYGVGDYAHAINYFKESLKSDPYNAMTLNNLGFALDISGSSTEAIKFFDLEFFYPMNIHIVNLSDFNPIKARSAFFAYFILVYYSFK